MNCFWQADIILCSEVEKATMRGVGILDEIFKLHLVALTVFSKSLASTKAPRGFFYNGVHCKQREDGVMIPTLQISIVLQELSGKILSLWVVSLLSCYVDSNFFLRVPLQVPQPERSISPEEKKSEREKRWNSAIKMTLWIIKNLLEASWWRTVHILIFARVLFEGFLLNIRDVRNNPLVW